MASVPKTAYLNFISSFHDLLNAYSLLGTLLGTEDSKLSKTYTVPKTLANPQRRLPVWPNNKSLLGTSRAVPERRGQKWLRMQGRWVVREDSRKTEEVSIYKWTREEGHLIQRALKLQSAMSTVCTETPGLGQRKRPREVKKRCV